jgi:hypothetical protein
MRKYTYYYRNDKNKEAINTIVAVSRIGAAKWFAAIKRLPLKEFLKLYSVSK